MSIPKWKGQNLKQYWSEIKGYLDTIPQEEYDKHRSQFFLLMAVIFCILCFCAGALLGTTIKLNHDIKQCQYDCNKFICDRFMRDQCYENASYKPYDFEHDADIDNVTFDQIT